MKKYRVYLHGSKCTCRVVVLDSDWVVRKLAALLILCVDDVQANKSLQLRGKKREKRKEKTEKEAGSAFVCVYGLSLRLSLANVVHLLSKTSHTS